MVGRDVEVVPHERESLPMPVLDVERSIEDLERLKQFIARCMVYGTDYGPLPANPKETFLFKSGCEKLAELYGYAPDPEITNRVEQWDRVVPLQREVDGIWVIDESKQVNIPLLVYECRMSLVERRFLPDRIVAAAAFGSCNSMESVYRFRTLSRVCPDCGAAAVMASKDEFGGGYYCNRKKGGCGHGWKHHTDQGEIIKRNEAQIAAFRAQPEGRVLNTDIATSANAIQKKAVTRALRAVILMKTRSSGLFADPEEDQDDEDTSRQLAKATEVPRLESKKEPPKEKKGADGPLPDVPSHRRTPVEMNGRTIWSAGATGSLLVKIWDAARPLGEPETKALLAKIGKDSTLDLDMTQGQAFLVMVENAVAAKRKAAGA